MVATEPHPLAGTSLSCRAAPSPAWQSLVAWTQREGGGSEEPWLDTLSSSTGRESTPLRTSQTLRKGASMAGVSPRGCWGPVDRGNAMHTSEAGAPPCDVVSPWALQGSQDSPCDGELLNTEFHATSWFSIFIVLDSSHSKCTYSVDAVKMPSDDF